MKTVGCSRRTITCICSTNVSAFIIEICSQHSGNSCLPTCKANSETYCWTLLAELDRFFFQSVSVFVYFFEECLKNVLIYAPIWKEQSSGTKTTSTQILLNSKDIVLICLQAKIEALHHTLVNHLLIVMLFSTNIYINIINSSFPGIRLQPQRLLI